MSDTVLTGLDPYCLDQRLDDHRAAQASKVRAKDARLQDKLGETD